MSCRRCQGLMMENQILDFFEGTQGFMWTTSWRCVNCGHVYDAVIEQNRLAQQEQVLVLRSGKPDIRMAKSILEQVDHQATGLT